MMNADELMAKRIRQARTDANLTQVELATKAGISYSAIQKIEGGTVSDIKRSTIAALAHVLNRSPMWLMGYDNDAAAEVKAQQGVNRSPKSITLDSFQYAFYEQTEDLSEADKEMLLNIAKRLKEKKDKENTDK